MGYGSGKSAQEYEKEMDRKKERIRLLEKEDPQSDEIDDLYEEIGELAEKRDEARKKGNVDIFDSSAGIF